MIRPPAIALDEILEHSPFGIAVFDYAGTYESVNAAYCAIYGYSPKELLGKSITTVFPPDKHAWVVGLHKKFLDEGGVLGGEWEVVRRDQTRLHVISESVMLRGEDGHKRRLVFVMDITERQALEHALKTSEERLSLVMLGTEDGYFDADLVTGRRSYSERWWQMLGYTPDAWPLDGNHWQQLAHPDDLERAQNTMLQAMRGSTDRFEVNIRMRHQNGSYRHILARAYIGRNAEGRAIRLTGANTDLTERIQHEQQARHFQSIVESSDDAIISKSLDRVVSSWNAGAQAMFGYTAEEMIGQTINVLLPPDRMEEEDRILSRLKAGEKVDHFETVRIHKNGSHVHVSVTISPMRDHQGRVVGASKIARNISEKKALEARLQLTASVFSNTQEGIVVVSPQGEVVEVNPAFSHITGYAREELLANPGLPLQHMPELADVLADIAPVLQAHGHYQGEHWSRRKDLHRIAARAPGEARTPGPPRPAHRFAQPRAAGRPH